jgi:hypothetical protein
LEEYPEINTYTKFDSHVNTRQGKDLLLGEIKQARKQEVHDSKS